MRAQMFVGTRRRLSIRLIGIVSLARLLIETLERRLRDFVTKACYSRPASQEVCLEGECADDCVLKAGLALVDLTAPLLIFECMTLCVHFWFRRPNKNREVTDMDGAKTRGDSYRMDEFARSNANAAG